MQWIMVAVGAAFGAVLRAWLAKFNSQHEWMLVGTLAANILGGLLIGIALVYADKLHPHAKLFLVTGFLGGLTTFSTFSAEVITFINAGKLVYALAWVGIQVISSLLATALGFYCVKAII